MTRILLLGGTTEASQLAAALAARGAEAVFSYAGRTEAPRAQPIPTRLGGFGGVSGLCDYIRADGITHVIDATHPFAAQMSRNAVAACGATGTPLCAFERPPWAAGPDDDWRHVPDIEAAVAALPAAPTRIFLAIGRQHLKAFAARDAHDYLVRVVDAPTGALPLTKARVIVARGPFSFAQDRALLEQHRIGLVVAKNAGGTGARAKIDAARALGLPVIMIDRPAIPTRPVLGDLDQVLNWLDHDADRGV